MKSSVATSRDICILGRDFSNPQTSFILPGQCAESISMKCLISEKWELCKFLKIQVSIFS